MFNFTSIHITQAAGGGYLIRARTGDVIELHIGDKAPYCRDIKPAVYRLGTILVDHYEDTITFIDDEKNTIIETDGKRGTFIIMNNLVVDSLKNIGTS